MPLIKAVSVDITVKGTEDAKLKISEVRAKAEELKNLNPEITPKIDAAKALIEARLLRAGLKAEFEKNLTENVDVHQSLISRAGAALSSGLTGITSGLSGLPAIGGVFGAGASDPAAAAGILAAVTAAAAALAVEATGIVAGLAAATVGVGAFAAVAMPTFQKLTGDISALHDANEKFQESALNVDTAIKHSSLDAAAYNKALAAMPPNLRAATKLLGDQNARWQDLSVSQQNSIVALANNKTALTSLLPAQKTSLTALLAAKTAWDDMNPAQQKAATSLNQLSNGYQKIVAALQPAVFKVFNDGLKVANSLLPVLQPIATSAAAAIDGLLKRFEAFTKSAGFQAWLKQFEKLIGPSITAVGVGAGNLMVAIGKLLTVMSAKDVVNALNIAFTVLAGTIRAFTGFVRIAMLAWTTFERGILGSVKVIIDGLARAFSWAPILGPKLAAAAKSYDSFEAHILGGLGSIQGAAGITAGMLAAVGNAAVNAFSKARGASGLAGIGSAAPHAAGGPSSGLALVGERGPELVMTPPGSYVYNHQQTQAMMSGGGNTYNINVYVPPNANKAELGRVTVDAIREFEKRSGHGWRK